VTFRDGSKEVVSADAVADLTAAGFPEPARTGPCTTGKRSCSSTIDNRTTVSIVTWAAGETVLGTSLVVPPGKTAVVYSIIGHSS
jgi:hypothetical protein